MSRTLIRSTLTYHVSMIVAVIFVLQLLSSSVNAFSPILTKNVQHHASGSPYRQGFRKYGSQIIAQSAFNDENNDDLEDEIVQNLSTPSSPDNAEKPMDPLIQALTRMDDETINAPTIKAPLFGEIPLDGSLVVLVPTVLIAVAGLVFSIIIGVQSKDLIADQITQVTEVLSTPPSKPQKVTEGCRGLCSDQTAQYEILSKFMLKLAKEPPAVVADTPAIVPTTTSSDIIQEPTTATQGESSTTSPIYGTAQLE